jgi:hypothetical protein
MKNDGKFRPVLLPGCRRPRGNRAVEVGFISKFTAVEILGAMEKTGAGSNDVSGAARPLSRRQV